MFSTAFPTSHSLNLKVTEFKVGTFKVDSTLFICVWPIPAWRQPSAARVLMLKAGGPRNPDLCCPEVVILLCLPQNEHFNRNVLAKSCRSPSITVIVN